MKKHVWELFVVLALVAVLGGWFQRTRSQSSETSSDKATPTPPASASATPARPESTPMSRSLDKFGLDYSLDSYSMKSDFPKPTSREPGNGFVHYNRSDGGLMMSGDGYFNTTTIISIKDPLMLGSKIVIEIGAPFETVEDWFGPPQGEDTAGSKVYILEDPKETWRNSEIVFYPKDGKLHQITIQRLTFHPPTDAPEKE